MMFLVFRGMHQKLISKKLTENLQSNIIQIKTQVIKLLKKNLKRYRLHLKYLKTLTKEESTTSLVMMHSGAVDRLDKGSTLSIYFVMFLVATMAGTVVADSVVFLRIFLGVVKTRLVIPVKEVLICGSVYQFHWNKPQQELKRK